MQETKSNVSRSFPILSLTYFPQFADLVSEVNEALAKLAMLPGRLTALAGVYREWVSTAA
jgi:hypothetical protein